MMVSIHDLFSDMVLMPALSATRKLRAALIGEKLPLQSKPPIVVIVRGRLSDSMPIGPSLRCASICLQ